MKNFHRDLITEIVVQRNEKYPFHTQGHIIPTGNAGELICTWTAGGWTAPLEGNIVLASRSKNDGDSWEKPAVLFSHPYKGTKLTALDSFQNVLTAYLSTYFDSTALGSDVQTYFTRSEDAGENFSMPKALRGCYAAMQIHQVLRDHKKQYLVMQWREIDGGTQWAAPTIGRPPKDCMIAGQLSEHCHLDQSSRFEDFIGARDRWEDENTRSYVGVLISEDNGINFRLCNRIGFPDFTDFTNPTMAILNDGTMYLMMIAEKGRIPYYSISRNAGESWSNPAVLDIPIPQTEMHLYTDKRGTVYLLQDSCDAGTTTISLWISYDNMKTWSVKQNLVQDNTAKIGYPSGCISENENMFYLTWEDGEKLYFSRIPLSPSVI